MGRFLLPSLLSLCVLVHVCLVCVVGVTTVSFSRYAQTCDSKDLDISTGTSRFVYSFSPNTPRSNSGLSIHSRQGTKSVNVFDPRANLNSANSSNPTIVFPPNTNNFTVAAAAPQTIPFPSRSPSTSYYCNVFQLPQLPTKNHIVRMSMNINPPTNVKYVHHLLLYVCNPSTFNTSRVGYQGDCDTMPSDLSACLANSIMYGWAVGGEDFILPSNAGMPLGTSDSPRYVVMQTHYNNPNQDPVVDQSGVTIYHTTSLRQYDAGIYWQGQATDSKFSIPAGQTDYTYSPYCPAAASRALFPNGIKVFSGMLHMHQAGTAIRTRVIRGGNELKPLMTNNYYDFNFQSFETLPEEREILPGDEFITECHYNTLSKSTPTVFGEATTQEMCMGFFAYYPATTTTGGARCTSGDYSDRNIGYASQWTGASPNYAINLPNPPTINTPYTPAACTKKTIPTSLTTPRALHSSFWNPSCYAHKTVLDSASNYILYWDISADSSLINMALTVNNTAAANAGWVGFGVSPTGGMVQSDVFTFWLLSCIDNPTSSDCVNNNPYNSSFLPQVRDRFATAYALPGEDTSQDVFNVVYYTDSVSVAASNAILSSLQMSGNTCMAVLPSTNGGNSGSNSVPSSSSSSSSSSSTGAGNGGNNSAMTHQVSVMTVLIAFFFAFLAQLKF